MDCRVVGGWSDVCFLGATGHHQSKSRVATVVTFTALVRHAQLVEIKLHCGGVVDSSQLELV